MRSLPPEASAALLFVGLLAAPMLVARVNRAVAEPAEVPPLVTSVETGLLERARAWPPSEWTTRVSWPSKSRLVVERAWTAPDRQFTTSERIEVDLVAPGAPAVTVHKRTENAQGDAWAFHDVTGTASISSDGHDLGAPDGPALAIEWQLEGTSAGSLEQTRDNLLLTREQLLRPVPR